MEKLFAAFHDLIVAQGAWGLVIFLLMMANVVQYRQNGKLQDRLDGMIDARIEQGDKLTTTVDSSTQAINGLRAEISVLSGIQQALRGQG